MAARHGAALLAAQRASISGRWPPRLRIRPWNHTLEPHPRAPQAGTPYTPPFKELIAKVDAGEVSRFDCVRKYGGAAQQNWGAEFTVAAPAELSQKFAGKSVLHTHHPAAQAAPNDAHTKPKEKKYEPGFGYTVVDTGRVRGVQQTASACKALP
ncbi:MAG TPA: hypothetical protein PK420_09700 [Rubrivivax sp.]|nr:hypothetical protein [Rubrivivax sp.]